MKDIHRQLSSCILKEGGFQLGYYVSSSLHRCLREQKPENRSTALHELGIGRDTRFLYVLSHARILGITGGKLFGAPS